MNRLNITVTDAGRERIESLKQELGKESNVDVIRLAVTLLQTLIDAKNQGCQFILRDADGNEREIIILLE